MRLAKLVIWIAILLGFSIAVVLVPTVPAVILSIAGAAIAVAVEPRRTLALFKPLLVFIAVYIASSLALQLLIAKSIQLVSTLSIACRILGMTFVATAVVSRAPLYIAIRSCSAVGKIVFYSFIAAKVVLELSGSAKELIHVAKLNYGARKSRLSLYIHVVKSLTLTSLIKVLERFEALLPYIESVCSMEKKHHRSSTSSSSFENVSSSLDHIEPWSSGVELA